MNLNVAKGSSTKPFAGGWSPGAPRTSSSRQRRREAVLVASDLRAIQAYVENNDNRAAARKIALRIIESVEMTIRENPGIGRLGRAPGTREFVIARTPYIVPYRLSRGTIQVLRVYHGARRWPDRL